MPAHRKTLRGLASGTFLARRHADRLLEPLLEPPDLATLQLAYAAATNDAARRAIARAFEAAVRGGRPDVDEKDALAQLFAEPEDEDKLSQLLAEQEAATEDALARAMAKLEERQARGPSLSELLERAEASRVGS